MVAGSDSVKGIIVLSSIGLRLRVRARASGSEMSGPAGGADVDARLLRATDRVMGPKYPLLEFVSEGVGVAETTRGVLGKCGMTAESLYCVRYLAESASNIKVLES